MPTPTEILQQMRRPVEWTGWTPTYSGKGYRPWAEDPGALSLEDVAYGLAHTFRYGGHSDPAITVAEHSVMVARIVNILWPGNPHLELAGLMHDAAESVLHDIQSPLRKCVSVTLPSGEVLSWNESDLRVTRNITRYFGIVPEHLEAPEVRAADILAASFEKRDCQNLRPGDWGLPPIPIEVAEMRLFGYAPKDAQQLFLLKAGHLLSG